MKVFVAGATGFIGGATCRALAAAGHEVTGLARSREKALSLEEMGARVILGDLDDPAGFRRAAGTPEVVMHFAATWFDGRDTIAEAEAIGRRILSWTRALADLARDSSSRLFVLCSSHTGDNPEAAPARPGGYERLLEASQKFLLGEGSRLPSAILCPGWVYGPGGWFAEMVRETRAGETAHLVGDGAVRLAYIHVDDVGEAFRLAAEKARPGSLYYLQDEAKLTARQFVEETARALGVSMPRGFTAERALREKGEIWVEALQSSYVFDTAPARRDLGWRPRYPSAREGLPAALCALGT
jgi:nucleoside-diphosphate-sugar epimerase